MTRGSLYGGQHPKPVAASIIRFQKKRRFTEALAGWKLSHLCIAIESGTRSREPERNAQSGARDSSQQSLPSLSQSSRVERRKASDIPLHIIESAAVPGALFGPISRICLNHRHLLSVSMCAQSERQVQSVESWLTSRNVERIYYSEAVLVAATTARW
jgi:hypothetical protein